VAQCHIPDARKSSTLLLREPQNSRPWFHVSKVEKQKDFLFTRYFTVSQQPTWTPGRRKTETKALCHRKGRSRRRDWDEPGMPKIRSRSGVGLGVGSQYVVGTVMINSLTGKISFLCI
jgi:hypothetical protein